MELYLRHRPFERVADGVGRRRSTAGKRGGNALDTRSSGERASFHSYARELHTAGDGERLGARRTGRVDVLPEVDGHFVKRVGRIVHVVHRLAASESVGGWIELRLYAVVGALLPVLRSWISSAGARSIGDGARESGGLEDGIRARTRGGCSGPALRIGH